MRAKIVKTNNKRIIAGIAKAEDQEAVYIQFKRLIPKEDIKEFEINRTCSMKLKKNIVITEICISKQAAYDLSRLLRIVLSDDLNKLTKPKTNCGYKISDNLKF